MRKRFNVSLVFILGVVMASNPLLGVAATPQRTVPIQPSVINFSNPSATRSKGMKVVKPLVVSRVLAKRPLQQGASLNELPGQSSTLLPDGRLLKIGGYDQDSPLASAYIEDPRTASQTVTPIVLQRARAWHTATMLPDGKVLIVGGVGADGQVVEAAELLDPDTGGSETLPASNAPKPRVYHTATLLTQGQVLVVGGLYNNGRVVKQAELWDFRQQTTSGLAANVGSGRYHHTATLLPDGNVLIAGGIDDSDAPVIDDKVFHSNARRFGKANNISAQNFKDAPLALEAALPADGAKGVALDALLAMRFSQPLRVQTVNAETVTLSGPQGRVETKLVPAEAGRLVFLTPNALLVPDSTYVVTLHGAIDHNGKALATQSFAFTTSATNRLLSAIGDARDEEEWIPDAENLQGNWRSHRADSPFRSLAALRAKDGVTALAGQALTLDGKPLAKVTIRLAEQRTTTDNTGRFLLPDIATGHQVMIVDGRSAKRANKSYGVFKIGVEIKERQTNVLPFTVWMAKLDTAHAVTLASPTTEKTVITNPRIPGLELHLPAQTLIRDLDGEAVKQISMTAIPVDRAPFPLPEGLNVPVFFTVQPGGSALIPPRVQIIYPNYTNEAAGTRMYFWNYDPTDKGWYIYGQGTVSPDKRQIIPDAGVVIYEFSGIMISTVGRPDGPVPECGAYGGDPVSLSTGLFVLNQSDLVLPDVLPIALTRTYRTGDNGSYSFGIGATAPFDLTLFDAQPNGVRYQEAYLIMPDGSRYRYDRISPGEFWQDAIFEHTTSGTPFYQSRLTWRAPLGWTLTLRDGTVFEFPESMGATSIRHAAVEEMRDRLGNRIKFTRNAAFDVTRISSPNGRYIDLSYDASHRVTQAKDNTNRTVTYTYDASGRLWKVTDVGGGITEYGYDTSNRMTTIKDAKGIVYLTNQYDANGRVNLQTQADNTTYQFAYTLDGGGKVTQTVVTDPRGNPRTVTFNASGYRLMDTDGCCGGVLSQTFEREAITNRVTAVIDATGRRTAYVYNATGKVSSVTELAGTANATTTSFTYEPIFNHLASVTDPLNHTTTFAYNSKGDLTSVTDPLNHTTTFNYNSAGQVVSATNALNHTIQYSYDSGDLTSVTDPLGNSISRFVDAAGRMLTVANAIGQKVKYEYDALNRLTKVIDPLQGATQFSYDANGNLLSVTDARNKSISYAYNSMERMTTRTDALTRTRNFIYDNNGNVTQVTDRKNQITNYTYDALDRLTLVTYHDGSTTSYTYDSVSRLTQIVDSISGNLTYTYDNLDRLLSETTPQGAVSYTYDAIGKRTTMSATGQATVSYSYDAADRLTQITQGSATVSYVYDNADRVTSMTQPNGVVSEYGYDAASRLTALTYKKSGVTIGSLTYEYDDAGRRVKMGGSLAQTGLPSALTTTSYNAANHQTAFGANTLTYDLNGNLTSDGVKSYTWNARNQLTAISGGGITASFSYDAFGRRTSKTINSTTTGFLYDGSNIVQEQSGGSATANLLTGGVDQFFSRTDASGTTSPLTNALGSVVALTDASGAIQTQYSYEPFGKSSSSGTTSSNSQKYTGREDDGTGLFYYRARYYSPDTQRFISEDPIGLAGGDINLYGYVSNNPIQGTDPSGLEQFTYTLDSNNKIGTQNPLMAGRKNDILRLPDYYAFNLSIGGTVGWAGQVVIDRNGNVYGATQGASAGVSTSPISGSIVGGWTLDQKKPTPPEMYDFLTEHSWNACAGGYKGIGAGVTTSIVDNKPKRAFEAGAFFPPQISGSWVYDYPWHERPKN